MKTILLSALLSFPLLLEAQNAITSDLVEAGKTVVELIKVIRAPKNPVAMLSPYNSPDSCGSKKLADISFKNRTGKNVQVSMYLRIGNVYDAKPLVLTLAGMSQESLYELKAGIYKYRIETDEDGLKTILHEGELKLQPCDKSVKMIKDRKLL